MRRAPIALAIVTGLAAAVGCVGEIPYIDYEVDPEDPDPKVVPPLSPPGVLGEFGAALDLRASTIEVNPAGGLIADADEFSTVSVRLVDVDGEPATGVTVTFESTGGAIFTSPAPTDAFGRTTAEVRTSTPGDLVVRASALGRDLVQRPTINFLDCLSTNKRFERDVMGPVLIQCVGCHNAYGRAPEMSGSETYAMALPGDVDAATTNFAWIADRSFSIPTVNGDLPYVLAKPLDIADGAPHGGGQVITEDSATFALLERFVADLADPQSCPNEEDVDLFASVELRDPAETLQRARFALLGEVMTRDQLDAFDGTFDGVDNAVDEIFTSAQFQERLTEMLNDLYLTDERNLGMRALNQLPVAQWPQRHYFHICEAGQSTNCCDPASENCCDEAAEPEFCADGRRFANESVGRGAIEVLRHIIVNDLPFTEVLTLDRVLVNPYSAKVFGITTATFDDDPSNDRNEYVPARLLPTAENGISVEYPLAGLLSTNAFLRRYPTTPTNVNRHRARTVYRKYLDVDVMRSLQLVIDQEEDLGDNPTMDARTCSACHAQLDDVGATFQNWKQNARYQVTGWSDDLRSAGFKLTDTPEGDIPNALQWLASELVQDRRFALATVKQVHKLLTGRDALILPDNNELASYPAELEAYLDQEEYFNEQADLFIDSGYSLREAFKEAIKGRYFRAKAHTSQSPLVDEALEIAGVGVAKAITPEQLRRKLVSLTGRHWTTNNLSNGADQLLNVNRYRLLLGGHDSEEIVERFRDPFPISANVTRRMANEFGCMTPAQEFTYDDPEARKVLKLVDEDTLPDSPENEAAIRAEIQKLHLLWLGEGLEPGHPELNATYDLWVAVQTEGKQRLDDGEEGNALTGRCRAIQDFATRADLNNVEGRTRVQNDPNYTVRAWSAVFAYLMADYRFLHE